MESKVEEAVLAGKKTSISFPADVDEDAAMASSASPAAISAFLAPPLSLLRQVARACAGYLGLDGLKLPASSSTSAAAAQRDEVDAASEDCTVVVLQVRSRGAPSQPRSVPVGSRIGERGGAIH